MKDHVEISHLTKYDAFRVNRDQVTDLDTNVSNFEKASLMTTVKSCHAPSIWKKMRWKSLCLLILKSITEIIKYFRSLYDFGGRCLKIKDVCMDFEPYFKVHNLVSVHPKSVILGQMTNLNMIFHIVVSVYRLVKILKLAPVPWWISERLIFDCILFPVGLFSGLSVVSHISDYRRKQRQLNSGKLWLLNESVWSK